jgi:hypothetical protein
MAHAPKPRPDAVRRARSGRARGAAQRKAAGKRTDLADGEPLPVHSFHTLLGDLATLTRNVVRLGRDRLTAILATPTRTQHRTLDLLGVTPRRQTDTAQRKRYQWLALRRGQSSG